MSGIVSPEGLSQAYVLDPANYPNIDISQFLPLLSVMPTTSYYTNNAYPTGGLEYDDAVDGGILAALDAECWNPNVAYSLGTVAYVPPQSFEYISSIGPGISLADR